MNLDNMISKMEEISQDYSMPRRVKATLKKVSEDLRRDEQDVAVRITSAIYEIDRVANDINIPMHAKTALWDVISDLEALKGE